MRYRGFVGGGLGLGTPVVSYAPLPMLIEVVSLVIIKASGKLKWRVGVSQMVCRQVDGDGDGEGETLGAKVASYSD